jgi:hypothetical protein
MESNKMKEEFKEVLKHKVWYPIDTVEPIDQVDCLVTDGKHIGFMDFERGYPSVHSSYGLKLITHWMPIPELPNKK